MEWISAKEKRPDKEQWVLAYGILHKYNYDSREECKYEDCPDEGDKYEIKTALYDGEGTDCLWHFDSHCCESGLYHVTHWAELPQEPKD